METKEIIKEKLKAQIQMFKVRHKITDSEMAGILTELAKEIKPKVPRVHKRKEESTNE